MSMPMLHPSFRRRLPSLSAAVVAAVSAARVLRSPYLAPGDRRRTSLGAARKGQ